MSSKTILFGALVIPLITGLSLYAQPIAQYTFNDGTAADVTGNGFDGVLLGNAAIVVDPERGQVMQINGQGMQVDGPLDVTTAYTLAVWIKLDLPLSGRDYFGGPLWIRADDQGGSPRHWFEVNTTQNPRQFLDKFDTTSTGVSGGILDGQWRHFAFVLAESGEYKVYLDGDALSSRDDAVGPHDYGGEVGPLFCGAGNDSGSNGLSGYMDDIRIYNYAVSENEIVDLMTEAGGSSRAHDPQPENGAAEVPVEGTTLSWNTGSDPDDPNAPNPAITGHYLWLSPPLDPNDPPSKDGWFELPGTSVRLVPVGADPAVGGYTPASLQRDALYYWVVDESLGATNELDYDKLILGNIWSFETETSGPEVEAPSSVITWLEEGSTTVDLNGTVTDATGDVKTITWSAVSLPDGSAVNFSNASAAVTTATLNQTGRYAMQLHAVDQTSQEAYDLVEINVYSDSCEAAKNSPEGYTPSAYDFNADCVVDINDFAMFASDWLDGSALMDDVIYIPTLVSAPVVQFTNPLNGQTISGEVIINAIAYDLGVGAIDGNGMGDTGNPASGVDFEIIDGLGTLLGSHHENVEPYDWTVDTASGTYPNGVYIIRATAVTNVGVAVAKQISVTINN